MTSLATRLLKDHQLKDHQEDAPLKEAAPLGFGFGPIPASTKVFKRRMNKLTNAVWQALLKNVDWTLAPDKFSKQIDIGHIYYPSPHTGVCDVCGTNDHLLEDWNIPALPNKTARSPSWGFTLDWNFFYEEFDEQFDVCPKCMHLEVDDALHRIAEIAQISDRVRWNTLEWIEHCLVLASFRSFRSPLPSCSSSFSSSSSSSSFSSFSSSSSSSSSSTSSSSSSADSRRGAKRSSQKSSEDVYSVARAVKRARHSPGTFKSGSQAQVLSLINRFLGWDIAQLTRCRIGKRLACVLRANPRLEAWDSQYLNDEAIEEARRRSRNYSFQVPEILVID